MEEKGIVSTGTAGEEIRELTGRGNVLSRPRGFETRTSWLRASGTSLLTREKRGNTVKKRREGYEKYGIIPVTD